MVGKKWRQACYDIQAAFFSHYLGQGIEMSQKSLKEFGGKIRYDAKLAKEAFDGELDKHDDCFCLHRAIIETGARRVGPVLARETATVGMKIIHRYFENLS